MGFNELMGELSDLKRQAAEAEKMINTLATVNGKMANFDFSGLVRRLTDYGMEPAKARATAGQLHGTRADFGNAFGRAATELEVLRDMVNGAVSDLEQLRYEKSARDWGR